MRMSTKRSWAGGKISLWTEPPGVLGSQAHTRGWRPTLNNILRPRGSHSPPPPPSQVYFGTVRQPPFKLGVSGHEVYPQSKNTLRTLRFGVDVELLFLLVQRS